MSSALAAARPVILLVDDDEAVRRGLELTLDLAGYEVHSFDSGESLLGCDLPAGPICLVVDERLPGVSGLATLRLARSRRPDVRGLLITTHPPASLRAAARAAGAPILEKPLEGPAFLAAVSALVAEAA